MKPWVYTDKSILSSEGAVLSARASEFIRSVVPPLRGSKNVYQSLTQGLRPGLCRSVALTGLIDVFTMNQLLCCFDAVALLAALLSTFRPRHLQE